jgi:PAS domain-containing protein
MSHNSDPLFVDLPSSADGQQLSKSSTNNHDLEIQLRAAEERYRGLAEQVLDGIFIADSRGHYLDANQAGCEMLGYTLDELKKHHDP